MQNVRRSYVRSIILKSQTKISLSRRLFISQKENRWNNKSTLEHTGTERLIKAKEDAEIQAKEILDLSRMEIRDMKRVLRREEQRSSLLEEEMKKMFENNAVELEKAIRNEAMRTCCSRTHFLHLILKSRLEQHRYD